MKVRRLAPGGADHRLDAPASKPLGKQSTCVLTEATAHPAVADRDPFAAKAARLLVTAVRRQLAVGADHPPPRHSDAGGQHIADRSRRPRVAGAACHLAVADDFAARNVADYPLYDLGERRLHRLAHILMMRASLASRRAKVHHV